MRYAQAVSSPIQQHVRQLFEQARKAAFKKELQVLLSIACLAFLLGFLCAFYLYEYDFPLLGLWTFRSFLLILLFALVWAFFKKTPRLLFVSHRLSELLRVNVAGLRSLMGSSEALSVVENLHFSPELVDAHLQQALPYLKPEQVHMHLRQHYQFIFKFLSYTICLLMGLCVFKSIQHKTTALNLIKTTFLFDTVTYVDNPLVGNLEWMITPPAYTQMNIQKIRNTQGDVRALLGSEIAVQAVSERDIRKAELILENNYQEPIKTIKMNVASKRQLSVSVLLDESFQLQKYSNLFYHFKIYPSWGMPLEEKTKRTLSIQKDKPPRIEWKNKETDTEYQRLEKVAVMAQVEDDFGVKQVDLCWHINPEQTGTKEQCQTQPQESVLKTIQVSHILDLATMPLKDGDRLYVWIKAQDNAAPWGFLKSTSTARTIRIFSAQAHQQKILEQFKLLIDRLILILADELENKPQQSFLNYIKQALSIDKHAIDMFGSLNGIATELQTLTSSSSKKAHDSGINDSSVGFAVAVKQAAQDMLHGYVDKQKKDQESQRSQHLLMSSIQAQSDVIAALEKAAIYFEDLRGIAVLDQVKAEAEDFKTLQAQLKSLIQSYQQSKDANTKKEIKRQIMAMKQKLAQMMQQMSLVKRELSEQFVNKEAFARRDFKNTFDRIDQLLAEDNYDALALEMERLENQMNQFSQNLKQADKDLGSQRYAELKKELQNFEQNLDALSSAQSDVLEDTEKQDDKIRQESFKKLGKQASTLKDEVHQYLKQAQTALERIQSLEKIYQDKIERVYALLNTSDQLVLALDFYEAYQSIQKTLQESELLLQWTQIQAVNAEQDSKDKKIKAQEQLGHVKQAHHSTEEAYHKLSAAFATPSLTQEQKKSLESASEKQKNIKSQMQQTREQFNRIKQQAPIFDSQADPLMQRIQESMEQAEKNLADKKITQALQNQRTAMAELKKFQQQMQQQKQQGQGSGIPMPAFGHASSSESPDKVDIPQADSANQGTHYRKDIIEAMKQKIPDKYKKQVEDFYKELIE